jgi:sorting nexin-29
MKGIWEKEKMPEDWKASIICPIYRKGDKLDCRNYRGISLLYTTYKIFTYIMRKRRQSYAETAIGEYQCGFRPGRSTTDQLFMVRQNAEFWEYNIDLHPLFIDFTQAYGSINRRKMCEILQEHEVPQELIRLICMTMTGANSQVQLQGGKSCL